MAEGRIRRPGSRRTLRQGLGCAPSAPTGDAASQARGHDPRPQPVSSVDHPAPPELVGESAQRGTAPVRPTLIVPCDGDAGTVGYLALTQDSSGHHTGSASPLKQHHRSPIGRGPAHPGKSQAGRGGGDAPPMPDVGWTLAGRPSESGAPTSSQGSSDAGKHTQPMQNLDPVSLRQELRS